MKSSCLRLAQPALLLCVLLSFASLAYGQDRRFNVVEATIADIQKAITTKQVTATDIVHMYLERIKAYNGACVNQP